MVQVGIDKNRRVRMGGDCGWSSGFVWKVTACTIVFIEAKAIHATHDPPVPTGA
jgi:hypothetical protein